VRRVIVDPVRPAPAAIGEAADVIRAGGLVAMPTDTLYGIAADPFNPRAVARVFEAKSRSDRQPIALVAAGLQQVTAFAGGLGDRVVMLTERFWPGPLTLLVAAPPGFAVSSGTARVGVRVPAHAVARLLCATVGSLLTATSANLSGEPASDDPDEVERTMGDRLDLLLDAGRTAGGPPSTIVDVTGPVPALVRAGAIPWEAVDRCLRGE
jgi:L-threonylcarbamoyladenylate synthase